MIIRSKGFTLTPHRVQEVVDEFLCLRAPRLRRLREAYMGSGAITRRVREHGLPNNRLAHAYPRYMVTMASGYLVGRPVTYTDRDQPLGMEKLSELYAACDIASVDAELAEQAAIYGRGVCICYVDRHGSPRAATLPAEQSFVVYDDTVEHRPLFGVHIFDQIRDDPQAPNMVIEVYTREVCRRYTRAHFGAALKEAWCKPHPFGDVPMVEFFNNAQELGDFEPVLSLIEAYDMLQSDRVNDKQQFTDAVLLLTGCTLEGDDPADRRSPAQRLMEERTLSLPDTDARAEWLVKKGDEGGTEALRNAIKADIHKLSMIPDLTDEHFAGNASGVAMRYKLLGLEQLTSIKERWFREGLRARMRLFANIMRIKAMADLVAEHVDIVFTRSLPVNESEIAQMVSTLSGIVPQRTLLAQVPFVEDVDAALEEVKKEKTSGGAQKAEA